MAAPIRFLSGRQQQQKIGIEGNTGNEKVLEVVGRVGIGTTIFEPDSELEVRGDIKVSGIVTANNISVTSGDVNIDQLNVTGIATFGNTIDSNGRIVGAATSNVIPFLYSNFTDLPSAATYHGAFAHVHSTGRAYYAHAGNWFELVNKESTGTVGTGTERFNIGPVDLTTLDVSGISTFAGTADFNGDVDIDGHTELDNVNVSGVSTFTGAADFNGDVDIDGHTELDNVNVSGVSTFVGAIDANGSLDVDGHTELDNVNISGVLTATTLNVTGGGLGGSQSNLTDLSVSGLSTFTGAIDANGNLDVDGHTELDDVNVSGITTTSGLLDINAGAQANTLKVEDLTDNRVVIAGTGGELEDDSNLTFNGTQLSVGVNLDVDGHTELDDVNVSGASTFAGAIDANGGLDVSGGAGLVASSAKISDLTDNRIVIAGASGELEDTSKVTFDGTTLNIVGNATFTGNVSVAGTLTSEDKTNIDSLGIVTARTGVRIDSGGLVVTSGVSTFTDAIDSNGGANISGGSGLVASTAKVSDLTSGRVVTAGTGGELQDSSNFTFNGTTLAAPEFSGGGAGITGLTVDQVAGAINGITVREEGSVVGTASSVGSLNFVSSNLTASASGIGATIILTDNPSFTNITATNNISGVNVSASSSVTGSTLYGNGSNITGLTVDQVVGAVEGITIRDEGVLVGTANSIGSLNFVGPGISATASGAGSTITVAGFVSDADGNLFAGTCAGGSYDPSSGSACFNVFLGGCAGKSIGEGDNNVFLGRSAGCSNVDGSQNNYIGNGAGSNACNASFNNFIGQAAGGSITSGSGNNFIGRYAGRYSEGTDNTIIGSYAGIAHTTGSNNIMIGSCVGRCGDAAGTGVNGQENIFLGYSAGKCAYGDGCANNFIGSYAGFKNTSGSDNNFIGSCAGSCNTTGNYNTFFGHCAGYCNTSGKKNVYIGCEAGKCGNTIYSCQNIFLGSRAGYGNTSGCYNVVLGYDAAKCVNGGTNVIIGREAAFSALNGAASVSNNIFIGYVSGGSACSTGNSIHIGSQSGQSAKCASNNAYIGYGAGALACCSGCSIAIGQYAGYCNQGDDNIFLGRYAGPKSGPETGNCNIYLGYAAGCANPNSGCCNIIIGTQVQPSIVDGSNQLEIGSGSNRWISGDSSYNVGIGITNPTTRLHVSGEVTATDFNSTSDTRLKTNVQVIDDPLEKVLQINGVSFNWIENNKPSMGVIADNIEEVLPELVSDTDPKTVNYNGLIGLLIEVVKDQQTQINSLNERLSQLE